MLPQAKLTPAQSAYLDLLRAFAAMVVLFGHAAIMFLGNGFLYNLDIQASGVLIFFVMSGFLISYSAFRRYDDPNYGFREFFIDRFCRIYCAFFPALVLVAFFDVLSLHHLDTFTAERGGMTGIQELAANYNLKTWIGNLLMMHDYPLFQVIRKLGYNSSWFVDEFGSASPFWTICIEWWIYIAFGIIVLYIIRDRKNLNLWQWIVFGAVMVTPCYYLVGGQVDHLTFPWIFGMAFALVFMQLPKWIEKSNFDLSVPRMRLYMLGVFLFAVGCMVARVFSLKFDHSAIAEGRIAYAELQFTVFLTLAIFALFFFFGTVQKFPRIIENVARFVAGYSYSLYLIHLPILTYLYLRFPGNDYNPVCFWAAIVLCNSAAIYFWWAFERHYHALAKWMKSRLPPRRVAANSPVLSAAE
jgi:peptidoglycan/LPS O-acetylase OafA/YrhL